MAWLYVTMTDIWMTLIFMLMFILGHTGCLHWPWSSSLPTTWWTKSFWPMYSEQHQCISMLQHQWLFICKLQGLPFCLRTCGERACRRGFLRKGWCVAHLLNNAILVSDPRQHLCSYWSSTMILPKFLTDFVCAMELPFFKGRDEDKLRPFKVKLMS